EWRPGEAGPGRKFYLINTAGRQRLMALTASWQRYSTTVTRLLDEGSPS
ncbi:MAG: PadR family transcriptional regulator, partial [Cutibacterium granulosum]|nr:PadR family transcriptional regulator [Cutibacterium granulosum]